MPFPFDVIGILCGLIKYDVKKFFAAVFIGRFALYLALAYAGSMGIKIVLDYFL